MDLSAFGNLENRMMRNMADLPSRRDSEEVLRVPQLIVSVDVEAFKRRARIKPFQRLIWGHLEDGEGGILGIMRVAEKHGVRLTMFVDFAELAVYGEALMEVAQEIELRGHDLQIHCHPEVLPGVFWQGLALTPVKDCSQCTDDHARALFDYLTKGYSRASTKAPIAFRGGGYRFNAAVIRAMREYGIVLDSSFNAGRAPGFPPGGGIRRQFAWSNGCIELPISCVPRGGTAGQLQEFNFNSARLLSAERMVAFLRTFFAAQPGDIAVLVMHSWSFSKQLPDGPAQTYDRFQPEYVTVFDEFLNGISGHVQVVTAQEVVQDLRGPNRRAALKTEVV
jgi:hypothetical protein